MAIPPRREPRLPAIRPRELPDLIVAPKGPAAKGKQRWHPAELQSETTLTKRRTARRDLRDARRAKSATEALSHLQRDPAIEIYGFTKGQFSFLDLIAAVLEHTGPAVLTVATWTAAKYELAKLADLMAAGKLRAARFLVDYTFAQRDPAAAAYIRDTFGQDSFRITQTHAKFALFQTEGPEGWKVCIRTSANLNRNPRFEDFTVAHDPAGRPESQRVRDHFRRL